MPATVSQIEALSPRRRELLSLLAKGLTNDEIAKALDIASGTVRSHVTAVLTHLDVTNRTEAATMYIAWEARPAQVAAVMQRPAIAILPLAALGDEPRARTIAAGITEDLACLFARWCWFPVIATTSSSHARSMGVTSKEIGSQLGARFLVDGRLRSAGAAWRVSVRIDDGESGYQIWAEQYDCPRDDIFEVQDAICHAIVAAAYPVLVARAQVGHPSARPPAELAAWELAHEGMALRALREPEANAAAQRRFRDALARDPQLVLAHYGVGLACYDAVLNQWGAKDAALDLLGASGERCVELAPHAAEGHYLHGRYRQSRGEWDRAVDPLEAAVGRNPSFALAHASLSQSLQISGRSDEGLVRMRHAVRLGPRSFVAGLATLHFMRCEYAESLEYGERAVVTNPGYPFAHAITAAAAWWLGDARRGRAHLRALRDRHPRFRSADFAATFGEKVESVDRLTRALTALAAMS